MQTNFDRKVESKSLLRTARNSPLLRGSSAAATCRRKGRPRDGRAPLWLRRLTIDSPDHTEPNSPWRIRAGQRGKWLPEIGSVESFLSLTKPPLIWPTGLGVFTIRSRSVALSVACAVTDGPHHDLRPALEHFVHDDIRVLDELTRALVKA